ncbi:DnaJ domain-containing protein [Pasteurella multocida]
MNINEALNVLNLTGTVNKADIAKAYKKLAVKYHPDRNPAGAEMMKVINSAYEFLKGLESEQVTHTDAENAYNYSEDLEAVISEVLKMQGVVIEICGNWIWLSGETKAHKEAIKALGFFWASKKAKWYYRPAEHKSRRHKAWDMEEIRSKYGSSVMNGSPYKALNA